MMKIKIIITSALFFVCLIITNAQTDSNLNELYKLIDSSVQQLIDKIEFGKSEYGLSLTSLPEYKSLEDRVYTSFSKGKFAVNLTDSSKTDRIEFGIKSAKVNYSELFRDGFFGSYKTTREIHLNTLITIVEDNKIAFSESFNANFTDTVDYDEIRNLETASLPFTKSKLPEEPLFPGLIEPAIAIGAIAVSVFLLFSVRSK
ncbi:MAG: hypothetical protein KJ799_12230 [Bacteroidetes bacterium]|nr:hypothetical protein [Bacteroidota bacterium]